MVLMNLLAGQEQRDRHTERRGGRAHTRGRRRWGELREQQSKHTDCTCETADGKLLCNQKHDLVLGENPEQWDGVGGSFKRKGTHAYSWRIHVVLRQRPTRYCKAIILQLKINFLKSYYTHTHTHTHTHTRTKVSEDIDLPRLDVKKPHLKSFQKCI